MTMTELAKQIGVSKQTLYNRVKAAGINLDEMRDKSTGELTSSAFYTLSSLFDGQERVKAVETSKQNTDHTQNLTALQAQIDGLRRENELLREMLAAKDAELERMGVDLEAWRAKAQEVNVQQLLLTMAGAEAPARRVGLLERVRRVFKRGDE